jgi:hypothetical protein
MPGVVGLGGVSVPVTTVAGTSGSVAPHPFRGWKAGWTSTATTETRVIEMWRRTGLGNISSLGEFSCSRLEFSRRIRAPNTYRVECLDEGFDDFYGKCSEDQGKCSGMKPG